MRILGSPYPGIVPVELSGLKKKSSFITKNDPFGQTLIRFHPAQKVLTKRQPLGWIFNLEFLYQLQFVRVQLQSFPYNFPRCGLRYLNSRQALRTDFLGLWVKVSRTLSTVSSVNLGFPARPFLDDRRILCNEIVHITFRSKSQEDHDVQIAVGTRVETPQNCYIALIPGQDTPTTLGR